MNPRIPTKLKRVIIVVVVLAIAVPLLLHYLRTGRLVVESSADSIIQVAKPDGTVVASKKGGLATNLSQGDYTLTVGGKVLSSKQVVTIHGRQTTKRRIVAPQAQAVEPVVSGYAQNIAANASELLYLGEQSLNIVNANNQVVSPETNAASADAVTWLDSSFGIVTTKDGKLYTVSKGGVFKELPINIDSVSDQFVFTAATPDHHVYFSLNKYLYYGSSSSGFTRVFAAKSPIVGLSVSANRVAIVTNQTKVDKSNHPDITAVVTLLTNSGKRINDVSFEASDEQGAPVSIAWSPNGKLLAISNSLGVHSLYDDSLTKRADLPLDGVTSLDWQDSNTLFFSSASGDNLLWRYNYDTQIASVAANASTGNSIGEIAVSDDKDYVYFSVTNTSTGSAGIYRVGLQQQTSNDTAYQLGFFFPADLSSCYVNYVNFTKPTLNVSYSGTLQQCQTELNQTLQQDELSAKSLQIRYQQVTSSTD